MQKNLKGIIISSRRGPKTQNPKEHLRRFQGVDSNGEAGRIIGPKIAWPIKKRKCMVKIVALYRVKELVSARFHKGLPSQALGSFIEVIG